MAAIDEKIADIPNEIERELKSCKAALADIQRRLNILKQTGDPTDPATFAPMRALLAESRQIQDRVKDLEPSQYRARRENELHEERFQVIREYPTVGDSAKEAVKREQQEREDFDRRNDPKLWLEKIKGAPIQRLSRSHDSFGLGRLQSPT